jgi:hypothetical protein
MEMRNRTSDGRIAAGARVYVKQHAGCGPDFWDTVRGVFDQTVSLEPYARNITAEAVVLTRHSWCFVCDVLEVSDD